MIRIFVLVCLLFSLWQCPIANAATAGVDEWVDAWLKQTSVYDANDYIRQINQQEQALPLLSKEELLQIMEQGISGVWGKCQDRIVRGLTDNIKTYAQLLGNILFLAVLCALLQHLQATFESGNVSLVAHSVCFLTMAVLLFKILYQALQLAERTIGYMVGFMEALLPLMLSLMAAGGGMSTVALCAPMMVMAISFVSYSVKTVVLPILFVAGVLEWVNALSGGYRISNLVHLLKQTAMAILGILMVGFIGLITIQGMVGSVSDSIALRTAKFATGTFIPVVGKIFADTVELVLGASVLLKHSVGIFGVICIALLCVFPLVQLLFFSLLIKTTGALIQPLGEERMASCLEAVGNQILLVFGAVLTVALMFFLALTVLISFGNAALVVK